MPQQLIGDSERLAEGQQVITACALIHRNFNGVEKVFLPRRSLTKKFLPGVFEIPGGHIDFGEDIIDGLKREIQEELGMGIAVGDPFACFTYMNHIKKSHSVEVVYFAEFTGSIDSITLHAQDHSEYVWIAADEIESVYTENKGANDNEFVVLKKGFELLSGGKVALS